MKALASVLFCVALLGCDSNSNPLPQEGVDAVGEAEPIVFNDSLDLDTQLVIAAVDLEIDALLLPLSDMEACRDLVTDMYLAKGEWDRVTETTSDTSKTHYYFHYSDGSGYGFQENSKGECQTNYRVE